MTRLQMSRAQSRRVSDWLRASCPEMAAASLCSLPAPALRSVLRNELASSKRRLCVVRGGGEARRQVSFEVGTELKVIERRMIRETLRMCNGDKNLAASLMGITARTIYRREAEWKDES
mgnify:CR=1 FL=1